MSQYYEMRVGITKSDPRYEGHIIQALHNEWEFEDDLEPLTYGEPGFTMSGRSSLCGGESEEEFSDRVAAAVFEANRGPCDVEVMATYLEELPCEIHCRNEGDYDRLTKGEVAK